METKTRLGEPIGQDRLPSRPDHEPLLVAVAEETGLKVERLLSEERSRNLPQVRQTLAYMAVRLWKQSQKTVAPELKKDASSVSHLLRNTMMSRENRMIQRILARVSSSDNGIGG